MIPLGQASKEAVAALFQGYRWNYLPDAILEGQLGEGLVDDAREPHVAVLRVPKLKLHIPAGDTGHPATREYVASLPRFSSLIFASEGWEDLLEHTHAGKFIAMQRYAFTSEKLDIEHLRTLASQVPAGYRLEQIDLDLAQKLATEKSEFASGHTLNFDSAEDFIARGFGFSVLEGAEIVSAATTFAICSKGIEIQVSTREKHRGKGLATAVTARLLIHSLRNGLDPNWDAENRRSASLAERLGYTPQGSYDLWLFTGSRWLARLVGGGLKLKDFFEP